MNYLFSLVRLFIRDWFFGYRKALLSGTYAGWLTLVNGHHDYFTLNLTEDPDHTLTILGGLSGDDTGAFRLDGSATANSFHAYGQIAGTAVVFDCRVIENANAIRVCDANEKQLGTWRRVTA